MINYPNGKKEYNKVVKNSPTESKKEVYNAANRGMDFEHAVNLSCSYYEDNGIALLYKRPTPIKILKTDYKHARITDAVFEKQSNTDYNGVYKGRYIDFECKETLSKTSIPFHNIPVHQIKHLKKVILHGGIAFFLIYFKTLNEVYLVDSSFVIDAYEKKERSSISYSVIKEKGHIVNENYMPRLDFIKVVDEVYFK